MRSRQTFSEVLAGAAVGVGTLFFIIWLIWLVRVNTVLYFFPDWPKEVLNPPYWGFAGMLTLLRIAILVVRGS